MSERPSFQRQQYAFAAHIRDPERNPAPPGIEDRRMAIYRDLFFNNVSSLLAGSFPVIHRIFGETRWRALMRDYFARHVAHTPYFLEMPQEFLLYLQEERGNDNDDPAFLLELAHYEWAELAVSILETDDDALPSLDVEGDLLDGVPVLNPAAWSLVYGFPVHRIGPDFQPDAPGEQPTYLVVYRDRRDTVGFLEINAVTARLIELVSRGEGLSGRELLGRIAEELRHPNPATVVDGGRGMLEQLARHDIVLGVLASPDSGDNKDG